MILEKIRVLEFAGLAPAPFCGKILADYGAKVTKIDKPMLTFDSGFDSNKRSVIIDLKKPSGIQIAKKLCISSDVIIDPYRPGVMEKLGLGPTDIMQNNPLLIYARLSGYGQSGCLSPAAGHDINYVALSGILSMLGRKGSPPTPPINLVADFAGGGLLCAFGIILALFHRVNTGTGTVVDLSMSEGAAYVGSFLYSTKNSPFWTKPRGENMLDSGSHFYDTFETRDGKFMSVGAIEPSFFHNLLTGLGLNPNEITHMDDFVKNKAIIAARFKEKAQAEWIKIFENLDACVMPVLSLEEAPLHPHNVERNNFRRVNGMWQPTVAPKLTDMLGNTRHDLVANQGNEPPYPEPGEHSEEILTEAGYSPLQIEDFFKGKIILSSGSSKL